MQELRATLKKKLTEANYDGSLIDYVQDTEDWDKILDVIFEVLGKEMIAMKKEEVDDN